MKFLRCGGVFSAIGMMVMMPAMPARALDVPNPSFEQGGEAPESWTLNSGTGGYQQDGKTPEGRRYVTVTGTGRDSNKWATPPLNFKPSTAYLISFWARSVGKGGLIGKPAHFNGMAAVVSTGFDNMSFDYVPPDWQHFAFAAFSPDIINPRQSNLSVGQWQVPGTIAYDGIQIEEVQPTYRRLGGMELGDGERVVGDTYEFLAPFESMARNFSRPLVKSHVWWNTSRWVFNVGDWVIYRHQIGDLEQKEVEISCRIRTYIKGEMVIQASNDGEHWAEVGTISGLETRSFRVPKELLPAKTIWVRFSARSEDKTGQTCQLGTYRYRAKLSRAPGNLMGATRFIQTKSDDPKLKVAIETTGDGLATSRTALVARVENGGAETRRLHPELTILEDGEKIGSYGAEMEIRPGEQQIRIPYPPLKPGSYQMRFDLGGTTSASVETSFTLTREETGDYSNLLLCPYDEEGLWWETSGGNFGEALPGSSDEVGLWWSPSGWKISRSKVLPATRGEALEIRAARNEAEAAQFSLIPKKQLKGLEIRTGELAGPGGRTIPAKAVEVLKEDYVRIKQTSDSIGVPALWPDPLPPIQGALDLPAGQNQPFWVRVKVPKGLPAGQYSGTIGLSAEGWNAEVPIRVDVYDFDLPDRMTLRSSYRLNEDLIFRYQDVSDPEQQAKVMDLYWRDFSEHHISPQDPAALSPMIVHWPEAGHWTGGTRDTEHRESGAASLRLDDTSTTSNVYAIYERLVPIPKNGIGIRFWYKARQPNQHFTASLMFYDKAGSWMRGQNKLIDIGGQSKWGEWNLLRTQVTDFPAGATQVKFAVSPTVYDSTGKTTGTVWIDNVSMQDLGTGEALFWSGDFEPREGKPLVPVFDWTGWDRAMERAISQYEINSFHLNLDGLGFGTSIWFAEPNLLGYADNTEAYKTALKNYLQGVQEHLREKGWLKMSYALWFDEPKPAHYKDVMKDCRKLIEYAPEIPRLLTRQVEPELVGGPNIWSPIYNLYNPQDAAPMREKGDAFWWYLCTAPSEPYCTLFIDHPATDLRAWLWQTWKYDIHGLMMWQTNHWTSESGYSDPEHPQNPYLDPMSGVPLDRMESIVTHRFGNGDGRFIYPPEVAADAHPGHPVIAGPVDSIRWEMLRDGIEDYEYLAMLRRLLDRVGDRLAPAKLAAYRELLKVPASITTKRTDFTKNPAPILERRDEVAHAIEALSRMEAEAKQ